jgi:hypothetical protein
MASSSRVQVGVLVTAFTLLVCTANPVMTVTRLPLK